MIVAIAARSNGATTQSVDATMVSGESRYTSAEMPVMSPGNRNRRIWRLPSSSNT